MGGYFALLIADAGHEKKRDEDRGRPAELPLAPDAAARTVQQQHSSTLPPLARLVPDIRVDGPIRSIICSAHLIDLLIVL